VPTSRCSPAGTRRESATAHDYLEVDLGRVAAAIPHALDVYRRYVTAVATFVKELDS
jgi:hypothetical protein